MKQNKLILSLLTLTLLTACKTNKSIKGDYPPIPKVDNLVKRTIGSPPQVLILNLEWSYTNSFPTNYVFEIWESKDLTSWNLFATSYTASYQTNAAGFGFYKVRVHDNLTGLNSDWNK